MKLKSLILGAAAVAVATGAQAADLRAPAAEPADYVKICDAYGAGFFYIPGSQTCLKIGGYVRSDLRVSLAENNVTNLNTALGWSERATNGTFMRARAKLDFDTRTNTDFGLLRTYTELWFTADSGGTEGLTIWRAFIQWGGLTAGRAGSFWDYAIPGVNEMVFANGGSYSQRTNLLAYTASFGNGITATLSIEDGTNRRSDVAGHTRGAAANTVAGFEDAYGFDVAAEEDDDYGGHKWPDVVANISVTQSWGSAAVIAALHHVMPAKVGQTLLDTNGLAVGMGAGNGAQPNSEVGWAVGGGVTFNIPGMTGSSIGVKAAYSRGAVSYVHNGAVGFVPDMIYTQGGNNELTEGWVIAAGAQFVLAPQWAVAMSGSYAQFSNDSLNLGREWAVWNANGYVAYTAAPGLTFTLGVEYQAVDTNIISGGGAVPAGVEIDGSDLVGIFRIQRSF